MPEAIESGEVITLPYRITALSDFDPDTDGEATGGGCGSLQFLHCVPNTCVCANGEVVHNQSCTVFYSNWGSCSGGAGGAGGITRYYGGATSGRTGTVIKGVAQSITHTEPECALAGGATSGNGSGPDPSQCN